LHAVSGTIAVMYNYKAVRPRSNDWMFWVHPD